MGRNEMILKRNTVLKINRKQEKKDRIREKHFEKKTLRYKRPLLKVEESFRKLEKAKHVDKLKTLIHQNVRVNTKFMHKYHLDLFGTQPISYNRKRTDSLASNGELYQEHVNTDENTNIWYIPQEDALCFHLDEYIQTLTAEKIDRVTSHVQSEMKESYQNYLNMSIGDLLDRDLNINSRTEELSSSSLADHMDYINTACTASNISAEKQTALCDLIDRNQVIVVGSSRDDLNAFTQVPLLLLGHLLNSDSPTQARIVCSTPHQLTAQLAAKSLTKHLHSIVDLDVGFKKKNSPDCTNPILFCTNDHLMYYILDHLALTQVSHIILDRAQHRNDMFDLILLYLRLVLLPRRPDLKLIILSSPMFMEIFAKNFNIPYLKLSKVRKSNPVLYLENILKETSFVPSNSSEYGNLKIIENNFYKDYRERLEKHVNLLRLKGTLRADSISNNLNPELEGVHVGLLTSVLSHINGRACVVVFLPNDDTIRTVYQCLTNTQSFQTDNYAILKYQSKITKKSARYKELLKQDKTVIILVTDSIEAVDYMKHVSHIIDCGLYEKHDYLPHFNVNSRDMNWATRQIADERKAWCEKRNSCKFYRLYTSVRGSHLKGCCSSYLGRIRPDHVTYLIKRLSIHDVHAFLEHLDIKPQHRSIHLSIKRFKAMNILDSTEYLTPLGYALSCLPLPPHLARLAILGCIFSCIDPVLSIVAVLLHHDPFDQTMTEDVSSMKAKFSTGTPSDHLVWVQVLAWYQNLLPTHNRTSLSTLCESHGLLYDSLVLLHRVKGHLLSHLAQAGYTKSERLDDPESNVNAACGGLIVALVNAGLYPNVAVIRSPRKIVISKLMSVSIHPSSVYHATSVECTQHTRKFISYSHCYGCDMGSDTEKMYIEHISMVPSAAVILFSHDFHIPVRKQNKFSVTERAYHFRCASENMVLFLKRLRCRLHEIIESTIVNHSYIDWTSQSTDNNVLRCAVQLLRNQNDVCQVIDVEFKKKQKGKKLEQKKRDKR